MVMRRMVLFVGLVALISLGLVACEGAAAENLLLTNERSAVEDELSSEDLAEIDDDLIAEPTRLSDELMREPLNAIILDDSNEDDEFEFVGTVDSISTESWVIDGVPITVLPQTEIKGQISEGDPVKVHAGLTVDGELVAREIELAFDGDFEHLDDDPEEIEFSGFVESISGNLWSIGGQEVQVTDQTEVETGIEVGDWVKVEAYQTEVGLLVAMEIEREDDDVDGEDFDDVDDDDEYDDDDDQDDDYDDDDHDDDDNDSSGEYNDDHEDEESDD
jgi:hypothetical protein